MTTPLPRTLQLVSVISMAIIRRRVKATALDKAQKILGMELLPEDAEAQIDALYEIAPTEDKPPFDWIYEGLLVAQHNANRL